MENYKLVIVGGGPAGLAAAISAYDNGLKDIIILERENKLGGILNQCIHNGFGLHTFNEELTGPEYAYRFIYEVEKRNIKYLLNTTVVNVSENKEITALNENGLIEIKAEAIILSCGCRERPRGGINIAGARCAGIYSAGTAQKLVNIDGYMPGKEVVILGSGDIGLIMARRMTFEGAKVKAVIELMPYSSGLNRNIVQCLNDFNIPLYFSHTIVNIKGMPDLMLANEAMKGIGGDFALLSVGNKKGFIPKGTMGVYKNTENEEVCKEFILELISEENQAKDSGIGFPIHKRAFENKLKESQENGLAYCVSDGGERKLNCYLEDNELMRRYMNLGEEVNTPIYIDEQLLEILAKESEAYIREEKDLDETVQTILAQTKLYLME